MRRLLLLLGLLATTACALPRWPVDAPLTSPYGIRFPGLLPDLHRGVDLAAPLGTPITAMQAGKVEFAGTMPGYGLVVAVRHDASLRTVYAHLSKIAVRSGDRVEGQQVIGLS
ncbi:MAG: M23 family metallopeptidase, partial [Gemmatimonadota bacterium]